jgi:c-di-GMP-binding flagellar brake protein YcgR
VAPKDKDLEPIKDKKVVERYLRYALDFREKFYCLLDPAPPRFEALLKKLDLENLSLELEITEASYDSLSKGETKRLESLPKDLRLSFAVNDVLYFLHSRLVERRTRQIAVTVDLPMFKLQRRDAVRIKPLESHNASVEVEGKNYLLHDLSASGLSFVVMPDQEREFIPKQLFRSCRLRFTTLDVPVDLEVMGITRMRQEGSQLFKVGFRFLGLTAAVEQHLAREAYLYTHKIWSRWL